MVTISENNQFYEIKITLPRTKFNKELLNKLFGLTCELNDSVSTIYKSRDFNIIMNKVKDYLDVVKILNI